MNNLKHLIFKLLAQQESNDLDDEEHQQDQARILEMERLITFMKNYDLHIAAFMTEQPMLDNSIDNTPITAALTVPTTAPPIAQPLGLVTAPRPVNTPTQSWP
ncbi:unnamed protein product [Arabis nemorensis]|uniref:Uncharacterized protein n=1 Tax=Arabis nemorensis TaxID=586526 RepID=A0A565AZE2_9BRAS|nr:unnamed protein product [Arabis nemorensis]